jgi:TolB protein
VMSRTWLACAIAVALAVLLSAPAQAAFPGRNGKLVFQRSTTYNFQQQAGLFVVDPYGIQEDRVTTSKSTILPAWSPDGQRIAFVDSAAIYTSKPDGTDKTLVLDWGSAVWTLSWSPDGTRLAAELWDCTFQCTQDIYTMNVDGSNLTNITAADGKNDRHPAWSPDGTKIAFDIYENGVSGIYTINSDGSGQTLVEQAGRVDSNPDWSPDGTQIAYQRGNTDPPPDTGSIGDEIRVMNADGSGDHVLPLVYPGGRDPAWSPDGTEIAFSDRSYIKAIKADGSSVRTISVGDADQKPDWQRLPAADPPTFASGYARPKGADRIRASLVPAYQACSSPNRTHGSPLAFPSCAPPVPTAPETIGTPDANGRLAQSVGRVDLNSILGDPDTPQNEADLYIFFKVTDVWRSPDNPGSDYLGDVEVRLPLRITDRRNEGGPDASATTSDFDLRATTTCAGTSSKTIGATCGVVTSANSLYPGAVTESNRTIWEIGRIDVRDYGPDSYINRVTDNRVLFTQGVFVP